MRKIKICIIIPNHWSYAMGGAQYQAKLITEALIENGRFDIYLLCYKLNEDFIPNGYSLIRIADESRLGRYSYSFHSRSLLSLLNKLAPDVIYQRVACSYTGISAYYCSKSNCKLVWHIAHKLDVSRLQFEYRAWMVFRVIEYGFIRYGIKRANRIIAQSQYQIDLLQKNYKRTAELIPNFHPFPGITEKSQLELRVVWVANLKDWKRPEEFVKLAKLFADRPDISFVMAGKNMLPDGEYKALSAQISESKNISYLGELSQEGVNELLASSHIFVNTSKFEGFPNTFVQAWMRHCAILSLEVNPDGIFDGNPRIGYCAENNFDVLHRQLEVLISNASERIAISENGYQYAYDMHSMTNVEKLINIFVELSS